MIVFGGNRALFATLTASAGMVIAAACSSSSTTATVMSNACNAPATPDSCSTGTPYAVDQNFVNPNGYAEAGPTCSECTPHCGTTTVASEAYGNVYSFAALPSGSCSNENEVCDFNNAAFGIMCNGAFEACNRTTFRCNCENGNWSCALTGQGKGACEPCVTDAGTE